MVFDTLNSNQLPTQPALPSVLFGSSIQFMPISEDVDLKLKELREKHPTLGQVFSVLDALDQLQNTSNLPVNVNVGAPGEHSTNRNSIFSFDFLVQ